MEKENFCWLWIGSIWDLMEKNIIQRKDIIFNEKTFSGQQKMVTTFDNSFDYDLFDNDIYSNPKGHTSNAKFVTFAPTMTIPIVQQITSPIGGSSIFHPKPLVTNVSKEQFPLLAMQPYSFPNIEFSKYSFEVRDPSKLGGAQFPERNAIFSTIPSSSLSTLPPMSPICCRYPATTFDRAHMPDRQPDVLSIPSSLCIQCPNVGSLQRLVPSTSHTSDLLDTSSRTRLDSSSIVDWHGEHLLTMQPNLYIAQGFTPPFDIFSEPQGF